MGRRRTDDQGRFKGLRIVDAGVDIAQRWWLIMLAIYGALFTGYAQFSRIITPLSWIDLVAFSFATSLALTGLTLGIFAAYRTWRMPPIPLYDKSQFFDDVVTLSDLVGDQELAIYDKKFTRCLIRGPGQVRFYQGNVLIYSSIVIDNQILTVQNVTNITGSIMLINCGFDRCHFENITILESFTPDGPLSRELTRRSTRDWKSQRWNE